MNWYVYNQVQYELIPIQPGTLCIGTYMARYKMNWYVYNQVQNELVHIQPGTK
jgi:hypothetical protein